ncbi:MAG: hypothetical protein JO104_06555 [Candidatus Eremiobacteraeota bacterium]|nr:hypothetical protein [Candidatus Eremiobacteraeota bacterium]
MPSISPGTVPPNGPNGGRANHLYVSVSPARNPNEISVKRFALVNGIPQSKADRVYRGHGDLLAVSSDGTLYAADPGNAALTVYAYDGGHTKPHRTIQVPEPRHCGGPSGSLIEITSLATDPQGNLFAGILTYNYDRDASQRAHTLGRPGPATRVPCNGVSIFAPNAKGRVKPIQSIDLGSTAWVNSLAVDAADNLYVGNYPSTILQYADAVKKPTQTRTFQTRYAGWVSSLATDAAGDIFVANTNYQSAVIDRYAPDVPSQGPPTNEISLAGSGFHALLSIAVRGRNLYANDRIDSLDLYHARKNGPQTPFYSVKFPYVRSVAVGP